MKTHIGRKIHSLNRYSMNGQYCGDHSLPVILKVCWCHTQSWRVLRDPKVSWFTVSYLDARITIHMATRMKKDSGQIRAQSKYQVT